MSLAGCLLLAPLARAGDDVVKKGGLSPEALWSGAGLIVGGTIHDVRNPEGPYFVGTLRVGVVFKGALAADSASVRIYGPEEKEGRSAIWLFRGSPDGTFTEEYPWVRAGPETFLSWPPAERERVLDSLPHADGESIDGMRLVVIRAPGDPEDPLSVWVALLSSPTDAATKQAARIPSEATLLVERRDKSTTEFPLMVPRVPDGRSADHEVRILCQRGALVPEQLVVARPPLVGEYAISLAAPLGGPRKRNLRATLVVKP